MCPSQRRTVGLLFKVKINAPKRFGRPGGGKVQFLFSDYTLDTDRRELRRGTEAIPVEPQVLDLLIFLLQNRGRVVTKNDLIASVWGGRIVSESALTSRITSVRKAIGDDGGAQRLIRTLPRKGLRFIGEVYEEREVAPATPPAPQSATTPAPRPAPPPAASLTRQ